MVKNMQVIKISKKLLYISSAILLLFSSSLTIHGEEVTMGWDEEEKIYAPQRRVSTAVGVYVKEGQKPSVSLEEGIIDGVEYSLMRVDTNENTLLQIDYKETPSYVTELVDEQLIQSGYRYVGGINAGYFSVSSGKPVGAVRRHNAWTSWYGEENTPAYGNGFSTAYITKDKMTLKYHGWAGSNWYGDDLWTWQTGYKLNEEFGISGSFTYYANGVQQDITNGDHGGINYRTLGRAVTILAQKPNKQYLLLTFYGSLAEERITEVLGELGVSDAIRLDGGKSTQMVYEDTLVSVVKPELKWSEVTDAMLKEKANALGNATVHVDGLIIRAEASRESNRVGSAKNGKSYPVYEIKKEGEYTWYRIGTGRWIANKDNWVTYVEKKAEPTKSETPETTKPEATPAPVSAKGSLKVLVDELNIRSSSSTYSSAVGKAQNGKTYDVYESYYNQGYTWYRIGENQWVAGRNDWVSYQDGVRKEETPTATVDTKETIGSVKVLVDGLNIRMQPSLQATKAGKVQNGKTYDVFETKVADGYTWYRIGENQWIAGTNTWVNYVTK